MTEVYTHYTDMKFFMTVDDISSLEVQLRYDVSLIQLKEFSSVVRVESDKCVCSSRAEKGLRIDKDQTRPKIVHTSR